MYAITARNVCKNVVSGNEKSILLKDINLQIHEGEIVFISGKYGSGRTTLLKMLAAMTPPSKGTIEIFGKNLLEISKRTEWRIKQIGILTHEECLIPYLTVKQNLLLGEDENDALFCDITDSALYILDMLDISSDKLHRLPEEIDYLDQLKVTVARVLMANPRLLLIDEFTKYIDEGSKHKLYDLLFEYTRIHQITAIITGEDEHCDLCDRFLTLDNGLLTEETESHSQRYH